MPNLIGSWHIAQIDLASTVIGGTHVSLYSCFAVCERNDRVRPRLIAAVLSSWRAFSCNCIKMFANIAKFQFSGIISTIALPLMAALWVHKGMYLASRSLAR
uniref:Uncharacterized protein n=1 Tax=Babesia bovis TaxID=5865 RepID=S6B8T5_BABBO|nr:hypothetical protein [Babesia bovis]